MRAALLAAAALILALLVLVSCGGSPSPSPSPQETVPVAGTPSLTTRPTAGAIPREPSPTAMPTIAVPPATPAAGPQVAPAPTLAAPPAPAVPSPAPAIPPSRQAMVDRAMASLAEVRGLPFLRPVRVDFLSPQETAAYLEGLVGEEEEEELRQTEALLAVLGLIDSDLDLIDLYLDLLAENVVGLYDLEEDRLVVRLEEAGADEEATLAHELVHALQQQHFNIRSLSEGNGNDFDRGLAFSALVEGDAVLATLLYREANDLAFSSAPDTPVFNASPPIIQEMLLFPYLGGSAMVGEVLTRGGWLGVDAAYRRPPQSTEQVLHPEKYLAGEAPLDLAPPWSDIDGQYWGEMFGGSWAPIYTSAGGELLLYNYLASRLSSSQAQEASAGWGGDVFQLYADDAGRHGLVWTFRWDSGVDAQEFHEACTDFYSRTGGLVALDTEGDYSRIIITAPDDFG